MVHLHLHGDAPSAMQAAPSYASSSSIRKNSGTGASSRLITLEEVQQAARNRCDLAGVMRAA